MAAVEKGPTQVQEVLAKGPVANPYPTLDEARSDPARLEKIRQVRRLIDEKGIKYIFFQQVSVSGHVNGKGVSATHVGPGRRGRLPARLRRHRRPLRRPERPLHRLRPRGVRARGDRRRRHLQAAALGSARRARLLRLLRHRDRRPARVRPAPEPEADHERGRAGARLHVPVRDRARDDVAQEDRRPEQGRGPDEAVVLPHQPVRGAARHHPRRRRLRRAARDPPDLRRPRGLTGPARAELPLRPRDPDGRQPVDLPADLRRGRAQARRRRDVHAEAVHRRLGERRAPPLHARRRSRAGTSSTTRPAPRSSPRSACSSWAASSTTTGASARSRRRRSTRTSASGTSASGRRSTRTTAGRTARASCAWRAAAASSSAPSTRRATRTSRRPRC